MNIPDEFRSKVLRMFGPDGETWLERLGTIFQAAVAKWQLTNWRLSPELSFNLVVFASSPAFGEVVLKVGVPHRELYTEMTALPIYDGRRICRCWDSDRELGVMLLERFIPGVDLDVIEEPVERRKVAVDLITGLPIPVNGDVGLPRYEDWVHRAFERLRREDVAGPRMRAFVDLAEPVFARLLDNDSPRVLLHGDLHHKNILLDGDDSWNAIDPKGIIGVPRLEVPSFVENELERLDPHQWTSAMEDMMPAFGRALHLSENSIAWTVFAHRVLSTCWQYEEYVDPATLEGSVDDCEFFLDYARSHQ